MDLVILAILDNFTISNILAILVNLSILNGFMILGFSKKLPILAIFITFLNQVTGVILIILPFWTLTILDYLMEFSKSPFDVEQLWRFRVYYVDFLLLWQPRISNKKSLPISGKSTIFFQNGGF